MNPLYPLVQVRARERCEYCHAPARLFNFALEVEHIIPVVSSGTNDLDNLALACRSCNAFKPKRQRSVDPKTNKSVALFHPRTDNWDDHFSPSESGLLIVGLTPTGRATIQALKMNSTEQQVAREQWKRLDVYQ